MTLYGLDLIVDKEGKPYLLEINGIRSGMRGFEQIYGDDRVQKKVYQMLEDRYGKLTVNEGTYSKNNYRKKHPFRYGYYQAIHQLSRIPFLRQYVNPIPKILKSPYAFLEWLSPTEAVKDVPLVSFPYPTYKGQESTVLNVVNDNDIPHPTVNSYVAEEITRNKFLQYFIFNDTSVQHVLPPTTLVGLGWVNGEELEGMMEGHSVFVQKPLLGHCGLGVKVIDKETVEQFEHTEGAIFPSAFRLVEILTSLPPKELKVGKQLEDLVKEGDFIFEYGVTVVQPFIDSKGSAQDEQNYSSIRAIVCNGQFIDAYRRFSPEPRVNLSRGAQAAAYAADGLAEFCEYIVEIYENQCAQLNPETFKKELYTSYFQKKKEEIVSWQWGPQDGSLISVVLYSIGEVVAKEQEK